MLEPEADRLRLVVLLHMPRDEPREVAALSAASAIVATSQWTRRWLSDHYALPEHPVHVVTPGVDAAEVAAGTPSGGRLLCVGAVTPLKGHDVLLDALATVDDPAWRCVCVGALDLDPEFAACLRRLAEDRGLGDRMCFVGPLTADELDRAYARGGRPGAGLARGDLRHGRHRGARPRASGHRRGRSVAYLRPSATQPTAAGPACWSRPATHRLSGRR